MRFTFFDSDHYVLEPGGEAANLMVCLRLALPWDRCCADDGGNPVCVLRAPQQAGACCAAMCGTLSSVRQPLHPPAHPAVADEIFIPAGVPHSTKNIAAVNSKWFYVSGGERVQASVGPSKRAGMCGICSHLRCVAHKPWAALLHAGLRWSSQQLVLSAAICCVPSAAAPVLRRTGWPQPVSMYSLYFIPRIALAACKRRCTSLPFHTAPCPFDATWVTDQNMVRVQRGRLGWANTGVVWWRWWRHRQSSIDAWLVVRE